MDSSRPDETPTSSPAPPFTSLDAGADLGHPRTEPAAATPQPARRGWNILAWPIILAVVALTLFGRPLLEDAAAIGRQTPSRAARTVLELQSRYLVGAKDMLGLPGEDLLRQTQSLDDGSASAGLRLAVLAGEFVGPQEAQQRLALLDVTDVDDRRLLQILSELYADQARGLVDLPSLDPQKRAFLIDQLGWFGRLALHPRGVADQEARRQVLAPAHQTVVVFLGGVCVLGLLAFGGFAGLIVLVILACLRKLQPGLRPGLPHAGVYAETFALWLVLFAGLTLLGPRLSLVPPLLRSGLVGAASLLALAWPVLRGIPWSQVRRDIGLHAGRSGVLEPGWGVVGYVMALPLVIVGFILTILLLAWQRRLHGGPALPFAQSDPSHPIIEFLIHGDAATRWQIFFLACIAVPIVEEIMFRGVLYRNVRELTRRAGPGWSIVLSGLFVSFLFAAIHPQGWVAIPLLMCLSFGIGIMREWRGSLIAPMIVHALSNGIVLGLLLLALGQ